ncbi:ABC transporter permease [Pseudarthrobacter phenanthrenivorans]|uniref:ABC-type dipeptide/oligopeptide/nickel transport system, permease component n=1 Tax=Pseudarthrobacter phenanthrenivorans (strain DSM 18606 / JCM 16027 / LMG 23796 / Sphe3) TaxID=930171 RepID=F0MAI1_PSEPM|nr:ABC transporter permease [Pseudarthrobacter phenanthrenivorans]ADX72849.1 ABC-type dipeptide/oligopeptide/nickel transport system, permease component [Pseudarthrobacter phenanthrenivorans Sphe3]TPV53496.1 ABC transporter permease [Pseudarthrobacter phenanthrenivorans]
MEVTMALFITRRLLMALATVLVVAVLAFLLVHAMPGSPGAVSLGAGATQEAIDEVNQRLGWNDPLPVQFFTWLGAAVQGDFGISLIDGRSVTADLASRLPVTASLAAGATLLSAVLGIALGVTAAVRGGSVDRIIGGVCGMAVALPAFWIGIIFVYLLAVQSSVFPATGYVPFEVSPQDWALSLALPVITLAVGGGAFIARQTRASMLEALQQEHIRTLRATATPTWKILYVHALRYASLPIVAGIALQFIQLFGGSVIAEQLFAMPGLGQAVQTSVSTHDAPSVQGVVVIATVVVVAVNLVLELATKFLDPKLRAS